MSLRALIQEIDDAIVGGTAERRAEILEQLTDVFVAGSAAYSDSQIDVFDDVFVRIAKIIEVAARADLANRLAIVPRAPSAISRILATDDDIDVAGPVLALSSRIDDGTLIAAARTKSQQHMLAISRRSPLGEPVTDVLVERGDRPVVLATAANPSARFSDTGYKILVGRSAGDDELTTCVALRRDIPQQHLFRLLVKASRAVQLKLEAVHPAMAQTIQNVIADAATKILDESGALSRNYTAARAHINSLHAAGKLDESAVAEFAADNKIEETTAALAALCDLPIEVADRAMAQLRPEAVLVMAKAVDMSWPTVKIILRLQAGGRGISPGELDQCSATFSRLNPTTVRQIVAFQNMRARTTRFGRSAA
jgi:uncharacterized protein (DUF2336 family)